MKDSLLIFNLFITIIAMFTLGISYEDDNANCGILMF